MKDQNTIDVQQIELSVKDGKPMVTSLQIAEHFERNHKDVIRGIRDLLEEDDGGFTERNFAPSEYPDPTGRLLPMYLLSRDAFMLVVMGYTGKEAMRIKKAYIQRFNEMEEALQAKPRPLVASKTKDPMGICGRTVASREACTADQLKGISGLLDFWAYVSGESRVDVEQKLCTAIPVSSLKRLSQDNLDVAYQAMWRSIFAIEEGDPSDPEARLPLDGLLDFWVYCGNETRTNVNNAVCQVCNLSSVDNIPDKDVFRAMLVAFMGISREMAA